MIGLQNTGQKRVEIGGHEIAALAEGFVPI